jgi:peptidyl-prolyl cis-trans isomerase A (cyclophilin A)
MIRFLCLALLALPAAGCGDGGSAEAPTNGSAAAGPASPSPAPSAPAPVPDKARVRLETEAGPILVEVDGKRAPVTAANFLRYVDEGRLDGTSFYRAAPTKGAAKSEARGFIQGGIRRNYRKMLPPIAHEPTSETGLSHVAGAISMARSETGVGAMGEFFITASAMPSMDAKAGAPGYAVFGKVVEGMDTVRSILAAPTTPNAGRGAMRGQMIAKPVAIVKARRAE